MDSTRVLASFRTVSQATETVFHRQWNGRNYKTQFLFGSLSLKAETTFHYCWEVKSSFQATLMESPSPMQLTDWPLVVVAMLPIWSDPYLFGQKPVLALYESSFGLPALIRTE
jgi:hypothetical protein